jgi:hypothetical protein
MPLGLAAFALAVFLLALGAALILMAFGRSLQPYLSLGESLRNWGGLLSAHPSSISIMRSTPFGYRAHVRHHRGWYRSSEGHVLRGRAGRVHVAPDQIARLGYSDNWDGLRLLDRSAFCLQVEDASESVDYLSRSGRFELVFYGDHFRSRDGYPMNCHLAVHFWVTLGLDEPHLIDRLMDRVSQLQREIERRVAGLLRDEFGQREYRQAFYEIPKVLDRLNAEWAADDDLLDLRQVLNLRFTALVVKPRVEAERRFLSTPGAGIERLRDRIRHVDEDVKQEKRYWESRWGDTVTALDHAVIELLEYPPAAIRESVAGLRDTVSKMGTGTHVVGSVDGMFLTGQRALARGAEKAVGALRTLQQLIEALAQEDSRLRAALAEPVSEPKASSPPPPRIRLLDIPSVQFEAERRAPDGGL